MLKRQPFSGSNPSTALSRPILPSSIRSGGKPTVDVMFGDVDDEPKIGADHAPCASGSLSLMIRRPSSPSLSALRVRND